MTVTQFLTLAEFTQAYNDRATAIGHEVLIVRTLADHANASSLYLNDAVSMVVGQQQEVTYAQVICGMRPEQALQGISAYATVLDVMTGCTEAVRKGWLERLGLFNGKLGRERGGTETAARGYALAVRPHNPGVNLMSFICRKA